MGDRTGQRGYTVFLLPNSYLFYKIWYNTNIRSWSVGSGFLFLCAGGISSGDGAIGWAEGGCQMTAIDITALLLLLLHTIWLCMNRKNKS